MLSSASCQFTSCNELLNYVQNFARAQEYAVTVKRSRSDKNGKIKNVLLKCNRGGCPFELYGSKHNNVWFLEVRNPIYNHEASINISGHLIVCRLDAGQLDQILSTIHQNDPSFMAISRMIYNALYLICQERLDSRTSIQALLDELQGSDFEFEYKYDHQNHIMHLFFAHKLSIALTHIYLKDFTHPVDSSNADLQPLLQSLAQQYHFWLPHQQAAAYA
ncbi:10339_t:CDS:2 [Cetraspora pellucida]|uniref:10339_t:CDS:1 n=1 Tax=Cetraspora pellucida TaxID=1433469 RepID=A0A9N8VWR9_9GLOM|nr:10339_t:CDS:2 [Cetraspora pellucida]